jgi:hypothetical protein
VIFHTKYPQKKLSAPPLTWNPGSAPVYKYLIGIITLFLSIFPMNALWDIEEKKTRLLK